MIIHLFLREGMFGTCDLAIPSVDSELITVGSEWTRYLFSIHPLVFRHLLRVMYIHKVVLWDFVINKHDMLNWNWPLYERRAPLELKDFAKYICFIRNEIQRMHLGLSKCTYVCELERIQGGPGRPSTTGNGIIVQICYNIHGKR